MRIAGVYAIHGPNGVYVGESCHCWERSTLKVATLLGLECGIIRELPTASRSQRVRTEAQIAKLFQRRGMMVVSKFAERIPRIRKRRSQSPVPLSPRNRQIVEQVASGVTLARIGRQFGISRQRVSQIIRRIAEAP